MFLGRLNVLVVGASRGIGLELVAQHRADGDHVVATARDDAGVARVAAHGATALTLDVTNAASCAGLSWAIDGEAFDLAWLVAGVYGPRTTGLQTPSQTEFDTVMHTNVLAAMRLLPMLADALAPAAKVGVLSSRMGSIGQRTGTIGWLYRASKAALNSVLKDASLALAGRATCVALHPGWVRTDMGGAGAALDVAASVHGLRRTMSALRPDQNGCFLDHDGSALSW